MKKLLVLFLLLIVYNRMNAQHELNVMTFNIRYNNPGDSINAWPNRKFYVSSQILFHKAHIVGVQEALHEQITDMAKELSNYKHIGVGRADGKQAGEYSAIFYDTTRLVLLQQATFWLAEQTNIPGKKGWDAAIERIVTWAKFQDKASRKVFYHFNTHFDHIGKIARKESANLVLQKVKEIAGKTPSVITGDFNASPDDEPIQVLTAADNPDKLLDTKQLSASPHYGPNGTFNGFRSKETSDKPIDYIFVNFGFKVLQHATLSQTWQGRFSSDHFPVFAVLTQE
jgi:endonuclease/exonuclease/phosphatase family metal-dependent hydrolase